MLDKYRLVKFNNSLIRDQGMVTKYASLGYFHYQYIKTLNSLNTCENLVKDNGKVVRRVDSQFKEGNYIEVSIADFNNGRKMSCLFRYPSQDDISSVGELRSIVEYIHEGMRIDETSCFVKFDVYTIIN